KTYLDDWAERFDPGKEKLVKLYGLTDEMRKAAAGISPVLFDVNAALPKPRSKSEANRLLIEIERDFALPEGIPNRNWFKHLVFGTRSTYAALLLPELTEAAEAGNERGVTVAITHLEEAVGKVVSKLMEIAALISPTGT
ncbi:MAG: transferrin receptor-like dimerization domain-containing protein, partial [Candidatus Aminicenantales bacterium]